MAEMISAEAVASWSGSRVNSLSMVRPVQSLLNGQELAAALRLRATRSKRRRSAR